MKKTISITINKTIFQVEEDGYQRLKAYLDSIADFYSSEENREILADIEASIAEKFAAEMKKKKFITMEDVDEIIKTLGTVEEFSEEAESGTRSQNREKKSEDKVPRRLYRNPDDKIIGGVCGGLAAYFDIDPVFVRIAFFVISIFYGIGFFAYLLLWLILPAARTGAQKLEMRGRPVNLAEISEALKNKSRMLKEEGAEAIKNIKKGNSFYRILNFPFRILERIIHFLKRVFKVLGPVAAVFFGILFILGAACGILAISIAAGTLAFNADSPYIISDIPISDLIVSQYFYAAVASVYLIIFIPLVFFFLAGLSLIKRKNAFRALPAGILIAVWMLSIVAGVALTGKFAPIVAERISQAKNENYATRSFELGDFEKIYLGRGVNAKITQSEDFRVLATGRQNDIDLLKFNIESGQLQAKKQEQEKNGLCIFCFDEDVNIEINMPKLASLTVIDSSAANVRGFTDDLYVSMGENGQAEIVLNGQNIQARLSGAGSNLSLSGRAKNLEFEMDGGSRLKAKNLTADKIQLGQSIFSKTDLSGKVEELKAGLFDQARMDAFNLEAQSALVAASDWSRARIKAVKMLDANAKGKVQSFTRGIRKKSIKQQTAWPKSSRLMGKILKNLKSTARKAII